MPPRNSYPYFKKFGGGHLDQEGESGNASPWSEWGSPGLTQSILSGYQTGDFFLFELICVN